MLYEQFGGAQLDVAVVEQGEEAVYLLQGLALLLESSRLIVGVGQAEVGRGSTVDVGPLLGLMGHLLSQGNGVLILLGVDVVVDDQLLAVEVVPVVLDAQGYGLELAEPVEEAVGIVGVVVVVEHQQVESGAELGIVVLQLRFGYELAGVGLLCRGVLQAEGNLVKHLQAQRVMG